MLGAYLAPLAHPRCPAPLVTLTLWPANFSLDQSQRWIIKDFYPNDPIKSAMSRPFPQQLTVSLHCRIEIGVRVAMQKQTISKRARLLTCQQYLDFVPNSAYAQDIKNGQQWQLLINARQQGQTHITNQSTINYGGLPQEISRWIVTQGRKCSCKLRAYRLH